MTAKDFDPAEGFTTYHYQRLAEGEPLTLGHLRRVVDVADVSNSVTGLRFPDSIEVREVVSPTGERFFGVFG